MGTGRSALHPGPECFTPTKAVYICADLSVTFSLFACNRAADHTFRLDPLQAAILLVKLPHLEDWCEVRRHHAEYYNDRFKDAAPITPFIAPACTSIYNQYVIRVKDRGRLIEHLRLNNIGCEVYYPLPMHEQHEQECFRNLGYQPTACGHSSAAAREVLALPVYPELTAGQLDFVASTVFAETKALVSMDNLVS